MVRQPNPGETIDDWLVLFGTSDQLLDAPWSASRILLPGGATVRLDLRSDPRTSGETGHVLYAIPTGGGFGLLRFSGTPGNLAERSAEIDLIARLASMSPAP